MLFQRHGKQTPELVRKRSAERSNRRRCRGLPKTCSRGQRPHDGDRRADRKAYEALAHERMATVDRTYCGSGGRVSVIRDAARDRD